MMITPFLPVDGNPHIALAVALQAGLHEGQAVGAVGDGGVVDHVGGEGAVGLGGDALGKAAVKIAHGLQPALGVAGGQAAVLGGLGSDGAVAPVDLPDGAVVVNDGDLLRRLLEPEDGALAAVDAQVQAVVRADGHLAGPVDTGGAVVILHQYGVVVIQHPAGDDDVHLGQHPADLQSRYVRYDVLHMGAQVAQAVHAAGAGGIAAPLALLAAVVVLMGQPSLRILRHHGPDLADGAGGHQIPGVLGGDMAGGERCRWL